MEGMPTAKAISDARGSGDAAPGAAAVTARPSQSVAGGPLRFDPTAPDQRADPYPIYRRLRDEAPVHYAPALRAWCVSRYEDVQRVLNEPETFSSRAMFSVLMAGGDERIPLSWQGLKALVRITLATRVLPSAFLNQRNLIASDGRVHSALRAIVNRGFTPRRVKSWEPRVRELTAACLAPLDRGGAFDLVHDLAVPLPVTIIAEMLGVDLERREEFKRWSDTIIQSTTGAGRHDRFADRNIDHVTALMRYLRHLVRARREAPGDDLVSTILTSREGDGEALSDYEVVMFVNLLLIAGNETTTNLLGNAVNALLDHPDQLAQLAADPSRIPAAVEEALRFDAPVQMVFRTTLRETEIAGVRIPEGAWVAPLLGSANRDERRFGDPDRFDVTRDTRGHVGFGFGKHFCLGASLARLEATVALEALVPRLVGLRKQQARLEHVDSFLVRGPQRLELIPAST